MLATLKGTGVRTEPLVLPSASEEGEDIHLHLAHRGKCFRSTLGLSAEKQSWARCPLQMSV